MSNKNQDIYKLVEEVERQKRASLEDIYAMLDEEGNDDVAEVKAKVNSSAAVSLSSLNINTKNVSTSRRSKASFPDSVTFDTRFDCFKALIEGVQYEGDNYEYINAHKKALEDVYQEAFNNTKDLYVVESSVNNQINRITSKVSVAQKGYYDGLTYALKAIRKSKNYSMKKIAEMLDKSLN